MAVLERSELQASPLADLHAIADQLGLDGYRRLRKPELIDAILAKGEPTQNDGEQPAAVAGKPSDEDAERAPARRRRRAVRSTAARSRRSAATPDADAPAEDAAAKGERAAVERVARRLRRAAGACSASSSEGSPATADGCSSPFCVGSPFARIASISSGFRKRRYPSRPSWSAIACRSARGLAWSSERSSTAIVLSPLGRMGGVHPAALDSGGHPLRDQA